MQGNETANKQLEKLDELIIQIRHYAELKKDKELWAMADRANALVRLVVVSVN
jgi:hypothetical protein